ncbi:Fpg/Nei family DNA glycosylase [Georgenia sp. 10Sc9-8]|uniref:DNA-(apurinic or apyrimidinic site) lyase n=1 Tax=Georgenia halotolerans TaxID=3028317 RepID=A0ABT5TY74_9MICO|nr:Fpg/Nei family DNA glycosylase [Georgenia halotolerans]
MPEGNVVHRLALAFDELFGGSRLRVSSPQGRFADGAAALDGMWLVGTEAHGKQLFLAFAPAGDVHPDDRDQVRWLRVHLGLYGSWTFSGDTSFHAPHAIGAPRRRVAEEEVALPRTAARGEAAASPPQGTDVAGRWHPPAPRGAVRVRLLGEHGVADLTGPTACEVVHAAEKDAVHARLGPDPLRPDGDGEVFVRAVRARRRAVGELLMDQSVVAGVGNIYRAEALFRARVHPTRTGQRVPAARLRRLWLDLQGLMADGVAAGAIVTTAPEHRGAGDERWYVYHRSGLPCLLCGTRVAESAMAGRRLFWCPRCQRAR